MPVKQFRSPQTWTVLGGPQGGTISSLAIGQDKKGYSVWIGSPAGLHRSTGYENRKILGWERLPNAPFGIMSLVVSPNFAEDHTLVAGTHTGIYISENGGESWHAAQMPSSTSMVLSLCFSPDYLSDGVILAGTLEDGIFVSNSRGERWVSQGFGLLDPTVYALAISPHFSQDGLVYAGTGTTVYYSYNGGRAWRQLAFPEEAAPVLSMAFLTDQNNEGILFAGTETQGLYQTKDQGVTWVKNSIPATTINFLISTQDGSGLIAATDTGVLQSMDSGKTWSKLVEQSGAITVAFKDEIMLTGLADQGVWMATSQNSWEPLPDIPLRSLLGLALSPQFDKDGLAYLYGPEEGIWMTTDGGRSWTDLSEALPSLEINSLALAPGFEQNKVILAASKDGLLFSEDAGQTWNYASEEPCQLLSFSPNGRTLVASFTGAGIRVSENLGKSWQDLEGPWDHSGGQILTLAVTNIHYYYIAHLEGVGETMTLWQGKAGQFDKVISEPAGENPHVCFWFPSGAVSDRPWYTSLGSQVWKISSRSGGVQSQASLTSEATPESILSLSGTLSQDGQVILFACTGKHIYRALNAKSWTEVHDFGSERAIAFNLSSAYLSDHSAFALLLGGLLCKFEL